MPKHLSTVNQENDIRVANETLQGVDMAELFNDFTETSVHIQNSAQCHQVFNNCSVTIVMPKSQSKDFSISLINNSVLYFLTYC